MADDLLTKIQLLVAESRTLRKQAEQERVVAVAIRLDVATQVAISRERRAGRQRDKGRDLGNVKE